MIIIDILPDLASLWQETWGSPEICIAVLDGPVDLSHPCFYNANLAQIQTLVPGISGHDSASLHGTGVTSIIFAGKGQTMAGVSPGCRGIILPIFKSEAKNQIIPGSQLDLARAITQAVNAGAHIINISGGEFNLSGQAEHFLQRAVDLCIQKEVLIVSAVGNDGCSCLNVPAALPGVLAVGAMDNQGKPLNYSNWGAKYRQNGILAPGQNVPTAAPGGSIIQQSGTSYATALVSGIVGLLLSLQLKLGQKPDPYRVRDIILKTAIPCDFLEEGSCDRFLAGKLNSALATKLIKQNPPGPVEKPSPVHPSNVLAVTGSTPLETYNIRGFRASATSTAIKNSLSSLVYAIGTIGYDFCSEARRDSVAQTMKPGRTPDFAPHLIEHLSKNPHDALALTWTLKIGSLPVYAISPGPPFAQEIYKLLIQYLGEQTNGKIEHVSLPGEIITHTRLMSGQIIPVIRPEIRGLQVWTSEKLIKTVLSVLKESPENKLNQERFAEYIKKFFNRVYHNLENLGESAPHRAINFAATHAFNRIELFREVVTRSLNLAKIDACKSVICRPNSDCWDVSLRFFDPKHKKEHAVKVYRITIDISDVLPVTVGKLCSWNEYTHKFF